MFSEHQEPVREDWIDYNGHMNVGYYLLAFENASTAFFRHHEISQKYRERTNHAFFAAETHITFEREVKLGDMLSFSSQLLDWSAKWFNLFHFMRNGSEGYLAATNHLLFVHVDLATRRAVPMPADLQEMFATMLEKDAAHGVPPQAGRAISAGRGAVY